MEIVIAICAALAYVAISFVFSVLIGKGIKEGMDSEEATRPVDRRRADRIEEILQYRRWDRP